MSFFASHRRSWNIRLAYQALFSSIDRDRKRVLARAVQNSGEQHCGSMRSLVLLSLHTDGLSRNNRITGRPRPQSEYLRSLKVAVRSFVTWKFFLDKDHGPWTAPPRPERFPKKNNSNTHSLATARSLPRLSGPSLIINRGCVT